VTHEIDRFLEYLRFERNAPEKTVRAYSTDLMQLYGFLAEEGGNDEVPLSSVTVDDLRAFIGHCHDIGMKKSSISRKIAAVKSFYKYLVNDGTLGASPASGLHFPRKEKKLPRFLYIEQVEKILAFPLEDFLDYRDRALLETFYSSGARVSELASADFNGYEPAGGALRVMGKGSVERIVFLTGSAVESIDAYMAERRKKFKSADGPLFVNARGGRISVRGIFDVVVRRSRESGVLVKVSPHTFRHSFATELLNRGADIRAVQEMLGHRSLSTTQVYTHTTKSRLQKLYRRCHPHGEEKPSS
jgi:integrase/recombinase XerC